jgi:hypothetical protein
VRFGTWLPFGAAAALAAQVLQVHVSEAAVRRLTERAGAAYVAEQTAAVERLERETPPAPAGPARQQVSVDGAMVPLVGGEWAEVKTLALGTLPGPDPAGSAVQGRLTDLSYFSRMTDHVSFGRLATVETHRRGTETAGLVVAVVDGADWNQGFIDLQCPKAVRVLDWGHGSAYVAQAGQALFGAGTDVTSEWVGKQLQELRHGEPEQVLDELRLRQEQFTKEDGESPALAVVGMSLAYLEKRRAQIRYAEFAAQGYPIGSGAVESANKLVVEARLKGAGMHWARAHVDPMVALRTAVCSNRWEEAWGQVQVRLRQEAQQRTSLRRAARGTASPDAAPAPPAQPPPAAPLPAPPQPPDPVPTPRRKTIVNGRPTSDHPWQQWPTVRRRPHSAKL